MKKIQVKELQKRWIKILRFFKRGFFLVILCYFALLGGILFLFFKIIQGFFLALHR